MILLLDALLIDYFSVKKKLEFKGKKIKFKGTELKFKGKTQIKANIK